MRRRPGGAVRVLDRCARCHYVPDLLAGRREVAFLPTDHGAQRHELLVCRSCDADHADTPTRMEAAALAIDATEPVAAMEFVQNWGADPGRVQRTARHFLGADVYERERARLVAEREAREREVEAWQAQRRERIGASVLDGEKGEADITEGWEGDEGDDDDLPF